MPALGQASPRSVTPWQVHQPQATRAPTVGKNTTVWQGRSGSTPPYTPEPSAVFSRGDIQIHYDPEGLDDGFPILLLAPGGMRSCNDHWDTVMEDS